MSDDTLMIGMKGHVHIVDDLGNVLLDQYNAIHPQNMARVIARALSNESNYTIYRMAFGNGGTTTDAAITVTYNPPNDGQIPDTRTWDSRLYNEIYSEIVDEGRDTINPNLGTDPGSADSNVGSRPGGNDNAAGDPKPTLHVSGPGVRSTEHGLTSKIQVECVLNADEPRNATEEEPFIFDEIGLYTSGASAAAFSGYTDIDVGDKLSTDITGLEQRIQGSSDQPYQFRIDVDGTGPVTISLYPPTSNTTFGQLCEALNSGDVNWNNNWGGISPLPGGATIAITDETTDYPSITGAVTFGYLRFTSPTVGTNSSVVIDDNELTGTSILEHLSPPAKILPPVTGKAAGAQNDPLSPETERERLLTHLVFSPITKKPGSTLTIRYTITVSVARSQ